MQEDQDDNSQEKNESFDKLYEIVNQLLSDDFSNVASADNASKENTTAMLKALQNQLWNFKPQLASGEEKNKLAISMNILSNITLEKKSKFKVGDIQAIANQFIESLCVQHQTVQGNQNVFQFFFMNSEVKVQERVLIKNNNPEQRMEMEENDERIGIIKKYLLRSPRPLINDFFKDNGYKKFMKSGGIADCYLINLMGYNLSKSNFTKADFRKSILKETVLKRVKLKDTQLDGADITNAKKLKSKQLSEAIFKSLKIGTQDDKNEKIVNKAWNKKLKKERNKLKEAEEVLGKITSKFAEYNGFENFIEQASPGEVMEIIGLFGKTEKLQDNLEITGSDIHGSEPAI